MQVVNLLQLSLGVNAFGGCQAEPSCVAGIDLSPPSERSFETFFKKWFIDEHFPIMSELLKKELVFRAKQKGSELLFEKLQLGYNSPSYPHTSVRLAVRNT